MSKLISVVGSPYSGKTVIATKLAQEIYHDHSCSIVLLSSGMTIPSLGVICHHEKSLFSLAALMDRTDIYREDVLRHMVTFKNQKNFGILGYKPGDIATAYPTPTADKITALLRCCREIADYVIVDGNEDLISAISSDNADDILHCISPDPLSVAYYSGHPITNGKKILNITQNDIYLPIDDVKNKFKPDFLLPYSHDLRQQWITGTLTAMLSDSRYRKSMLAIAKAVI